VIRNTQRIVDQIVAETKLEDATFASIFLPVAHFRHALATESRVLCFYKDVSPSEALRKASREAQVAFDQLNRDILMRDDLFALIDHAAKRNEELDPESQRLLTYEHRDFLRNGLQIPAGAQRERFAKLKARLSEVIDEFRNNLVEDHGSVSFSPQELEGMLASARDRLEPSKCAGELSVTFKFPDYYALMRHVRLEETRRKYYVAYLSRCQANVSLFAEATLLRDQMAQMLDYANHAEYRTEELTAHSPEHVHVFLEGLRVQLQPRAREELRMLRELKESHIGERASGSGVKLFPWDISFYQTMLLQEHYAVDQEVIAQYFPIQHVVAEMLRIFEEVFGLQFKKASQATTIGGDKECTWHPDVHIYHVWDSDAKGGEFLGYLYLDLYVRDSKVGNASNFNLQPVSKRCIS